MTYGSLFTGMCGFEIGLDRAGMRPIWQCEKDKNCQRVIKHHYPDVELIDDVCKIGTGTAVPDLICGGFPCQDISVAGKRAGLAGSRSGLWHEFHRIIVQLRPTWVIIENVPGLLSSGKGLDMGTILGGLGKCGYGWVYRCLDLQFWGVPQRRRRVFIVGYLGGTRGAAQVLFEPNCLPWDPPPRRETGSRVAGTIESRAGSGFPGTDGACQEHVVARPLKGGGNMRHCESHETYIASNYSDGSFSKSNVSGPLTQGTDRSRGTPLAFRAAGQDGFDVADCSPPIAATDGGGAGVPSVYQCHGGNVGPMGTLKKGNDNHTGGVPFMYDQQSVAHEGVRRLTPLECLRLQSFPDSYLDLDPPLSDSAKYRMIGNSVAPIIVEWIAKRIVEVHK